MSIRAIHTISGLRAEVAGWRARGESVALVPTMGALHAGHGSLIEAARRSNQRVVVSVFVNPIQFNQTSDFERYPRTLAEDVEFCGRLGADVVFAPEAPEMYPRPPKAFVEVESVSEGLCGKFRPGHFRGVATVVSKLLNIAQPDRAYFGQKDAQQLAVIRTMVRDLNMPVEVVGVPTVREPDGLAMSSRNRLLSPDERRVAPALYRALCAACEAISAGETSPDSARRAALAVLEREPAFRLEYLDIVDDEMQPVSRIDRAVTVAVAAWLGSTRLIDNAQCHPVREE